MVAPAVKEIKKITRKPLSLLERKVLDNGTIFYKVLNGGGYKYDIWLHANGRTTCQQAEDGEPCPSTRSGRRCYHVQYALDLELLHEQQEAQKNIPAPKPELAYAPAVGACYSFRVALSPKQDACPGCQKKYSAGRCQPGFCFWNSWYRPAKAQ